VKSLEENYDRAGSIGLWTDRTVAGERIELTEGD